MKATMREKRNRHLRKEQQLCNEAGGGSLACPNALLAGGGDAGHRREVGVDDGLAIRAAPSELLVYTCAR